MTAATRHRYVKRWMGTTDYIATRMYCGRWRLMLPRPLNLPARRTRLLGHGVPARVSLGDTHALRFGQDMLGAPPSIRRPDFRWRRKVGDCDVRLLSAIPDDVLGKRLEAFDIG